jgi:hypothetical protein
MKNEIKAFKKLIENQTAFYYFKHSVNIQTDYKIETREELAKYVESHHASDQLKNIILQYLAGRREEIEKVAKNIDQKGRNYTAGGNILFIKIRKLDLLQKAINKILNEPDDLDLEILKGFCETTNHPDSEGKAKEILQEIAGEL